jgi:cytochrome c-type biogenesis protein CcmH/NrfF
MEIVVNPLVNWVWVGFGFLALGTFIALLPEAAFSFAVAKIPANAVTTSLLLLALVLWPAAVMAQSGQQQSGQTVAPTERSALHRRLESDIMCTCGCGAPMGSCQMRPNCGHYDQQAARLNAFLAEGKGYDEVREAFAAEFGSQAILAAPIDRGFNRLAWLVPYLVAAAALAGIVVTARRWSNRAVPAVAGDTGLDPALSARLDDELSNLD